MRIEKTITIARNAGDVWEFVADPTETPFKPAVALTMDVVEFDPPHRLAWREEDADAVFNVRPRPLLSMHTDGAPAGRAPLVSYVRGK